MARLGGFALAILCLTGPIGAAPQHISEMLLNLPGVKGESTVPGFTGWIELQEYAYGAELKNAHGETVPLTVTKLVDSTSPILGEHYSTQEPFRGKTTMLVRVLYRGESKTLIKLEVEDAVVVSDKQWWSGQDLLETVKFSYRSFVSCIEPAQSCISWRPGGASGKSAP